MRSPIETHVHVYQFDGSPVQEKQNEVNGMAINRLIEGYAQNDYSLLSVVPIPMAGARLLLVFQRDKQEEE